MKILVISHHLPPKYKGGAEIYSFRQALWLQGKNHTVQVVTVEDIEANVNKLEVKIDNYEGLVIHRLYFHRLNYPNPLEASHDNPEIATWLETLLEEFKPDIMLVNACYLLGIGILRVAKLKAVPVILTLHDFWFLCQRINLMKSDNSLCDGKVKPEDCALCIKKEARSYRWADQLTAGWLGQALIHAASRGFGPAQKLLGGENVISTLALRRTRLLKALEEVDLIITTSRHLIKVFEKNGVPSDKFTFNQIGMETELFDRLHHIRTLNLEKDKGSFSKSPVNLKFGYLGQLKSYKGPDLLVKAFQRIKVPGISLTIYGSFDPEKRYNAKLKAMMRADGRIKYMGTYERQNLPMILANLDVVVVPSTCLENSPLVILEAQAAGLPVITTNLGGMAELVHHEVNGLLFARADYSDLENQINRLLEEPGLLEKLKAGVTEVYSLDDEFARLLPIYNHVVAEAQAKQLV